MRFAVIYYLGFKGHLALELAVFGKVDLPHTALAEFS